MCEYRYNRREGRYGGQVGCRLYEKSDAVGEDVRQ